MSNPEIDNYVQQDRLTCVKRSEGGAAQWVANIFQWYTVADQPVGSQLGSAGVQSVQIISLFISAKNAQEAADKAEECLEASDIEDAYVKDVYPKDIIEVQLPYDYEVTSEVASKPDRAVDIE